MSWDIFSKSKIQYFLEKLKSKFVQKETGKGLSTNDFDNTYKSKVDKIDVSSTSVSGNPISISGLKANQLAKNPIITLEPIQAGSGTPSPSNIRAISGYDKVEVESCGKNIFNGEVIQGRWSHTDGTWVEQATFWATKNPIPVIGGQSNYISNAVYRAYYDKNMTFISGDGTGNAVATTPANAVWMHITQAKADWSSPLTTMVAMSNTAITYVPYVKTTSISESLGQTVYWGRLNVRTGEFEVLGTIYDLGDLNYVYTSGIFLTTSISSLKKSGADSLYTASCYEYVSNGGLGIEDYKIADSSTSSYAGALIIHDSRYTDAPTFKTAIAGQKIVYKLATPFTIQLTPHEISLLKDYAYVSTNGTSIALDYHNGELASLADVSQLGETVNELSQAFQDGCDEIMGAVAAKGVTPASNSPDDISKAIRSLVTYEQPIEFDYRCGYITNGVWYYEKPTNTLSDIYEVKNGHTYYMFFGNTTGTRFRAITTTTDIRTVTSGTITGDQTVKNSSNPGALSYVTFTSTVDGYFIVCKDNVGKTGITTYMQDRTTM